MMPAVVLGMAAFLTQFDITAVVVAMPSVASDLGFGVAGYAWVMEAYSLAFTGTLMAAGAIADAYGRRRALLLGYMLFAVASIACGLSWNGPSLWAARVVQGIGAAFVVTGAIALIAHTYPKLDERTRAFAILGVLSGVAMALGPTIGGVISGSVGWRWIFFLNLPACLLVLWSVPRLVVEVQDSRPRPLDLIGVAILTLALGVAIESLLQARQEPALVAMGLLLSALLLTVFAIQQRRRMQPILDPAVFARSVMIGIAVVLFAVSVGYWAVLVYLPLFLLAALQWSPETAGLGMLTATISFLIVPPLAARLVARWGSRRFLAVGLALMIAGNLVLAVSAITQEMAMRLALVMLGMTVVGVGAAWVHPQLSGAVVALVPPEQSGMASAMTMVMRQAGFALGIAALGASLGAEQLAASFAWPFGIAAIASVGGLLAAVALLPPRVKMSAT